MRSISLFVPSLLVVYAAAAPGLDLLAGRDVCNANNCLRAVRATAAKPFTSTATSDCSSFMRKTVTPCPVTSTVSTTVTVTNSAVTTTETSIDSETQYFTEISTAISVETLEATRTITSTSTATETSRVTSTVTVSIMSVQRREVSQRDDSELPVIPLRMEDVVLNPRDTSPDTCEPITESPTRVPTYASACSSQAAYSSACSCVGITGATTTLTPVTIIATYTSTISYTPTDTASTVATSSASVTLSSTTTQISPFTTTRATLVIPALATVTITAKTTTTVSVTYPIYVKAFQRTDTNKCFDNPPHGTQIAASGDSSNNYQAGINQCATVCTSQGSSCQGFYFSDSTSPTGLRNGYCFLKSRHYQNNDYSCNFVTTTLYLVYYDRQ